LPLMALGLDGVISVIGNALPQSFSAMVRHALKGDFQAARQIHHQLLPIMTAVFREGSPAGIKFLLQELGLCKSKVRLPLVGISHALQQVLTQELQSIEIEPRNPI
ncbi:MAG: dihydrodipicolinate synthase family protein, partial [Bacteroidota bacterium]